MSAPNEGGGGGEEKQNHAVTLAEGQLPAPGHDGDLEEDREEKEGVATCGHGDGRDSGTQHEPSGDLRDSIDNANLGRLEGLLIGGRAKELLQQTYGGSNGGLDRCGLFSETLPLLHAAKCGRIDRRPTWEIGSPELFSHLCRALQNEGMLQKQLEAKDGGGRTVLHLAALSGDCDNLRAVRHMVADHLGESQILDMLNSKEAATGRTLLMVAAASGDAGIFRCALGGLRGALGQGQTEYQLKQHLMDKDGQGRTLVQLAALSGKKDIVDAVWGACRERGIKATEMGSRRLRCGGTALMKAVEDRDMDKFIDEIERELRKAKEPKDAQGNHNEAEELYDRLQDSLEKALGRDHPALATRINSQSVLSKRQVGDIVSSKNVVGETLLSKAIESGNVQLFELVRKCAWAFLGPDQRGDLVQSKNRFGESLLAKAFDIGDENLFKAALECVWEVLDHHQLIEFIRSEDSETPTGDSAGDIVACSSGLLACSRLLLDRDAQDLSILEAAVNFVVGRCNIVGANVAEALGILGSLGVPLAPMVLKCLSTGRKVAEGRSSLMDDAFADAAKEVPANFHADDVKMLVSLIANSARPSARELKKLSRRAASRGVFKSCCLRAVTSAPNPFIPGVTLSIRLSEAAKKASEGERRVLLETKSSIDELLLEIFERLPQTVRGFEEHAGMDACTNVLEPGLMRARGEPNDLGGPLDMIVSEPLQLETFSKVPLVMDFLSSKFSLGLPGLIDTVGLLRNKDQLRYLQESGLFRDKFGLEKHQLSFLETRGFIQGEEYARERRRYFARFLKQVTGALHGVKPPPPSTWLREQRIDLDAKFPKARDPPTRTFLPGAQFIVAGLVAAPTNFYGVPAMRMLLDFVAYIGMIAVLSYFVLYHRSTGIDSMLDGIADDRFSLSEGTCALIFITAGVYREGRDMNRDIRGYLKDQWNVLDALGILCLFVGLVIRWDDWTSTWGQAFYALSAPLVVSRVLFFAQILHFQGPMIQVIFRMTTTLLQFGAVMVVVMIGFTMALHVLFRDLEDFGDTLLGLFKAMLADLTLFDEFSGGRYDPVATFLIVVYLFIVTIMLLNLLIAVLSTSHSRVQANKGWAFKVSKARIITHYRMVVDNDVLPAPFNLVQLLLSLAVVVFTFPYYFYVEANGEHGGAETSEDEDGRVFWGNVWKGARQQHRSARRSFGIFVLWIVLGPVSIAGGAILWGLSGLFYAQYASYPNVRRAVKKVFQGMKRARVSSRILQGLSIAFSCFCQWISIVLAWFLIFLWCILGAPGCLFLRWLILPGMELFSWCKNGAPSSHEMKSAEGTESSAGASPPTIESMLKKGCGGVGAEKLLAFLQDPMNDKDVRQDEKDRKPTVEHMKLLRDRLERTTDKLLQALGKNVASKDELEGLRNAMRSELREILDRVEATKEELKERYSKM